MYDDFISELVASRITFKVDNILCQKYLLFKTYEAKSVMRPLIYILKGKQ